MDQGVDHNPPDTAAAPARPRGFVRALIVAALAVAFFGAALGFIGFLSQLRVAELKPSSNADGRVNLIGALRRSMATTGYSDLKEFQRVEVVVAPYSAR